VVEFGARCPTYLDLTLAEIAALRRAWKRSEYRQDRRIAMLVAATIGCAVEDLLSDPPEDEDDELRPPEPDQNAALAHAMNAFVKQLAPMPKTRHGK